MYSRSLSAIIFSVLKRIRKKHYENLEKHSALKTKDKSNGGKVLRPSYTDLIKEGFFAGVGWAFGVTIGFIIVSSILVVVLRNLGGLPLIGGWIASIVEETQNQLLKRSPIF